MGIAHKLQSKMKIKSHVISSIVDQRQTAPNEILSLLTSGPGEALFCPGSVQFLHATFTRIFLHVLGSSRGQRWPVCLTWDILSIEK